MEKKFLKSFRQYINFYFPKQKFVFLAKQKLKLESAIKQEEKTAKNPEFFKEKKPILINNSNILKILEEKIKQNLKPKTVQDELTVIATAASLDSLRVRIHQCQRCNLCLARKNIVYGQGNQRARILFIGEGPGAEEDIQGLPFVGRSGKLLTQMLSAIALNRNSVYITNIVKCRPPNNREPLQKELTSCSKILDKQIFLIKPKILVLLGTVALKWFFPDVGGIMKNHGKILNYNKQGLTIPTLVTFHPAFLLRQTENLSLAWYDLRKLRQLINKHLIKNAAI